MLKLNTGSSASIGLGVNLFPLINTNVNTNIQPSINIDTNPILSNFMNLDLFDEQDTGDASINSGNENTVSSGNTPSDSSSSGSQPADDPYDLFGEQDTGNVPEGSGNQSGGTSNPGSSSGGSQPADDPYDLFGEQDTGNVPEGSGNQSGGTSSPGSSSGDSQPADDPYDLFGDQDTGNVPDDAEDQNGTGTGTPPQATSNPKVVSVKSTGEILSDGVLSQDELDQNFEFEIVIEGVDSGAAAVVTINIEGRVYEADFVDGNLWVAALPATELEDGEMAGQITVDVTDNNGAESQTRANFQSTVDTDIAPEEIPATEDQGTGVVEMDLENMSSYTTGLGLMGVESDYNIELIFSPMAGGTTIELKSALIQVAEYVSTLITDDVVDVGDIDDLRITVVDYDIDGEGGKIAGAGVTNEREQSDGGTPLTANLIFDDSDLQSRIDLGTFKDTLLHELMHAVGFGTTDNWDGLIDFTQTYDGSYRFEGENAKLAYAAQHADIHASDGFSDIGVPVEANFGRGNAKVHWDLDTFDGTEGGLMAPGSKDVFFGKVDAMTLATLEDLGLETVWDASEPGKQVDLGYSDLPNVVQLGTAGEYALASRESAEGDDAEIMAFEENISENHKPVLDVPIEINTPLGALAVHAVMDAASNSEEAGMFANTSVESEFMTNSSELVVSDEGINIDTSGDVSLLGANISYGFDFGLFA